MMKTTTADYLDRADKARAGHAEPSAPSSELIASIVRGAIKDWRSWQPGALIAHVDQQLRNIASVYAQECEREARKRDESDLILAQVAGCTLEEYRARMAGSR